MRRARAGIVIIIALLIAGCGGGGARPEVAAAPAPPPAPAQPPAPAPSPAASTVVSAPARATMGGGPAVVFATPGGPSFTNGSAPGTAFPLLQSALALDIDSIDADIVANAAGGTARINAGQLDVVVPNRFDGVPATGHANLDWTRVGYWDNSAPVWDDFGDPSNRGAFVTGYRTPPADVPTSGAATYTGVAQGSVFYPRSITGRLQARDQEVYLAGTASLTADFGTRSVTGTLTGMTAVHRAEGGMIPPWNGALPWNDLAFTATVAGNGFSGSASVTSTPSGIASLSAGATGTIEGGFFGPTAQETGAVWTLFDGTRAAIGTLSGKRP